MYSRKRTYIFGLARAECFITFVRSREDEVVDVSIVANKAAHNVVNVYVIHEKPF